jgi:hypothetical protein
MKGIDVFTEGFIDAMFFTEEKHGEDDGNIDSELGYADIAPSLLAKIKADCNTFQSTYGGYFNNENCSYHGCEVDAYAGHDFWLTRNGHGCGFWDGDWAEPVATVLTEAAKGYGKLEVYVGDDNLIYACGFEDFKE